MGYNAQYARYINQYILVYNDVIQNISDHIISRSILFESMSCALPINESAFRFVIYLFHQYFVLHFSFGVSTNITFREEGV